MVKLWLMTEGVVSVEFCQPTWRGCFVWLLAVDLVGLSCFVAVFCSDGASWVLGTFLAVQST